MSATATDASTKNATPRNADTGTGTEGTSAAPTGSPIGKDTERIDAATAPLALSVEQRRSPEALLEALGVDLEPELLVHALTHRSFAHEHPEAPNNERLEFLGDAVLELVVTETMYAKHPDFSEGQLAKMRAKAVSEESLSAIARTKLGLGPYILLGHGESEQAGFDKDSILCDTVEALIGATFVQHGIEGGRKVVHRLVDDTLEAVANAGPALDWKTSLTVLAHKMGLNEPRYRMEVTGPQERQIFIAHVLLDPKRGDGGENQVEELAVAQGTAKRKAQLAAAEIAYHTLESRGANA